MVGRVLYCADYLEPGPGVRARVAGRAGGTISGGPGRGAPRRSRPIGCCTWSAPGGRFPRQRWILEPRRRVVRAALIASAAFALLSLVAVLLQPRGERVAGHAYAIPEPSQRIRVEVLNGTQRPGLARTATRALREHGLDVVFFGTGSATDSTRVLVRRGDPGQGRDVADALGGGQVSVEPDSLRRVDVRVLLGPDWRPHLPLRP